MQCIIFLVCVISVSSIPIEKETVLEEKHQIETQTHGVTQPPTACTENQAASVKCDSKNEEEALPITSTPMFNQEPSQASAEEQEYRINPQYGWNYMNMQPWPANWYDVSWRRSPYKMDSPYNPELMGRIPSHRMGYSQDLPPYAHLSSYAAYNPVHQVRYLPPVRYNYADNAPFDTNAIDAYNYYYDAHDMGKARLERAPQEEEDFMTELSHDAIMNNFLPTMPVPFVRHSNQPMYYRGSHAHTSAEESPVIAVFPHAESGGCAKPILFSCSPHITQGTIGKAIPAPISLYRHPAGHTNEHLDMSSHNAQYVPS